jgi:hypothetical protein
MFIATDSGLTSQLLKATLKPTAHKACEAVWGPLNATALICAFDSSPLKTFCFGDAGGPLIDQKSGLQIGIASFIDIAVCEDVIPAGYTVRNWLLFLLYVTGSFSF